MSLKPLITAKEGFPALETLALAARHELLLSFRIFDPRTRIRTPALRDAGINTWSDLLGQIARRGVTIKLLLSDFDAVFAADLHRLAWASASGFADNVMGDVQILCAPHGQSVGPFWQFLLRRKIREKVAALSQDETRLTPLQRQFLTAQPVLRPVTIHQKFAIADGAACVIGGLDVNERRYDTPDHDRDAEETWHDVSIAVSGDFAASLREHFADSWNAAIDWDAVSMGRSPERMILSSRLQPDPNLRVVRTMSRPCTGWRAFGPKLHLTEHEDILIREIGKARDHIYIETQFLRHAPIADALANAGRDNPDLQLIIVMPPEPERILFEDDDGPDARHGQYLQFSALRKVQDAFQKRVAILCPAKPKPAGDDLKRPLANAGPVYVHSKVTLIDGTFGLVGSANLNGRSMRWDTEASVLFRDPTVIQGLLQRLADKWLGQTVTDPTHAQVWNTVAEQNANRSPENRQGFVLPYPMQRVETFARRFFALPDDMF